MMICFSMARAPHVAAIEATELHVTRDWMDKDKFIAVIDSWFKRHFKSLFYIARFYMLIYASDIDRRLQHCIILPFC